MQTTSSVLLNRLMARARLRHMQVLVQLAELGSVRRTAQAVGMTQPGVSQILADLERMLDVTLFHRHSRGVRPTPACTDVLPLARQMLLGLAASAEAVSARRELGQGVVRLIASTSAINGLLVRALPEFNRANPAIQVQVREGERDDQMLAIARGEIDLALCRQPPVVPEGWAFRALLEDRFVVACAADHPLARRRNLELAHLAGQTWLPSPAGSAARVYFDAMFARVGDDVRICQVITRTLALTWELLRQQPLLTVVPYCVVAHLVDSGELAALKMRGAMPLEPIGLMTALEDPGAATARLTEYLVKFTGKPRTRERGAGKPHR